jgi:hypothetical protein
MSPTALSAHLAAIANSHQVRLVSPMTRTVLLLTLALTTAAQAYEMADLQALAKDSSWAELMQHLGDIAPSKRDAKWAALAEQGADGWLRSLELDERNAQRTLWTIDDLVKRYPALKKSKLFLAARTDVGLKAFGLTYSQSSHSAGDDPWLTALTAWVKADATQSLPAKAAKLAQERLVARVAWPLWKLALERGAQVCADADFHDAILSAYTSGVWAEETTPVIEKCWSELKAPVLKTIEKNEDKKDTAKLCTLAKAHTLTAAQCPSAE